VPTKTTQKKAARSRRKRKPSAPAKLAMLTPAEDAVVGEQPSEDLDQALARRTRQRGYRACHDLEEAEQRVRVRAGGIRDHFLYLGRVFNDVAEHRLFEREFATLTDWIESPRCVLGKSQAHLCRRALKLHDGLLAAGLEPLPSITFYRITMAGAPEETWVERADAIRGMSTRAAEKHLRSTRRRSEHEAALDPLRSVLKACSLLDPSKITAALPHAKDGDQIAADLRSQATVLLSLMQIANGIGLDSERAKKGKELRLLSL
jgi:hypothetical protein